MDFDPHVRVDAFEPADDRGEEALEVGRVAGDRQHARASRPKVVRHHAQTIRGGDYALSLLQERRSAAGEPDPAAGSLEQLHPELTLEALDLLPERRLRDPDGLGGGVIGARPGHLGEIAEVA